MLTKTKPARSCFRNGQGNINYLLSCFTFFRLRSFRSYAETRLCDRGLKRAWHADL